MAPYAEYTDDQIKDEIAEYRAARKQHAVGGGVQQAAGEGRMIKYFGTDVKTIDAALRELAAEARSRGLAIGGVGGAIPVEIG